jgi:hypothetical protein
VTRLGALSPNGRLLTVGDFFNRTKVAHILSYFFLVSIYYIYHSDEKWVGLYFGRFFHKLIWSPGRPFLCTTFPAFSML